MELKGGNYFSHSEAQTGQSAVILCKRDLLPTFKDKELERSHLLRQLIILFDYRLILILKRNHVDVSTS